MLLDIQISINCTSRDSYHLVLKYKQKHTCYVVLDLIHTRENIMV